jgi:uncharacterized membrane protein
MSQPPIPPHEPPHDPPHAPPPAAPPPPPPQAAGAGDPGNRTLMMILAYVPPLTIIPFLVEQNDPEVRWHAKHGLVLLGVDVGVVVFLSVLGMLPFVNCVVPFVGAAMMLGLLVLHVLAIVKAVNGERFKIPVVSDLADKF